MTEAADRRRRLPRGWVRTLAWVTGGATRCTRLLRAQLAFVRWWRGRRASATTTRYDGRIAPAAMKPHTEAAHFVTDLEAAA